MTVAVNVLLPFGSIVVDEGLIEIATPVVLTVTVAVAENFES